MYCPECFNDSLDLSGTVVVDVVVNGKRRDNGRFIFRPFEDDHKVFYKDFSSKLEDFFKWYSEFQNKDPIENVSLITSDVRCQNGCQLEIGTTITVNYLIPGKYLVTEMERLSKKYKIPVTLKR